MTHTPEQREAGEVTVLLHRLHGGDRDAFDRLLPLLYEELRGAARRALAREQVGHTLQATDLVHEAFVKLVPSAGTSWQDRAHFLAVASRAMRQVLVEHARRRLADKRGGGAAHVTLGEGDAAQGHDAEEMLALDDALSRLEALQPRLRAIVEHRFFGGLSEREIAEVLGVSERTVQRDWMRARAWLHAELYPESGTS